MPDRIQIKEEAKQVLRGARVNPYLVSLIVVGVLGLLGGLRAWRRLPTEARRTPSPNSGWPMAAMALALDVQLRKPAGYTLHRAGRPPTPADTLRACALGSRAAMASTLLACALLLMALAG